MNAALKSYRVWMNDGYAVLVDAESEDSAKQKAIDISKKNCDGAAMDKRELRRATTVDYVNTLN